MLTTATINPRRKLFGPEHHRILERALWELRREAHDDDPTALRDAWALFERELTAHLDAEERFILPRFAEAHADEAQGLRREHDEIRRLVLELGVGVDLHCLRATAADQLIDRLRAHARREDALLYPWAAQHPNIDEEEPMAPTEPKPLDELKTLLDELRVKMHLAGMDTRDAFHKISHDAQKLGREAGHASHEAAAKLLERLRSLAATIADGGDQP